MRRSIQINFEGTATDDEDDDDEADIMIMLTSRNPNTEGNDVR